MSVVKDEKIHFATNLMENIFTIQKLNVTGMICIHCFYQLTMPIEKRLRSIDAHDVQINFCLDDENDELIFCSCDGETFIIDKYNNIINFKLGKDISAFCAGIICQFFSI